MISEGKAANKTYDTEQAFVNLFLIKTRPSSLMKKSCLLEVGGRALL